VRDITISLQHVVVACQSITIASVFFVLFYLCSFALSKILTQTAYVESVENFSAEGSMEKRSLCPLKTTVRTHNVGPWIKHLIDT